MTLIELIVAFTILLILSTMALPLARVRVQREKERRLRDALTEMRKAIDRYKDYADAGKLGQIDPESHGYPESLEQLVEGVELSGSGEGGFGNTQGSNFGQPMGQSNRSNRGMGSNRSGSNRSGSGRSGFGSSAGGFGSSSSGLGQSGRGSNSSRSGLGSSRGGIGSSGSGRGAFGSQESGSDDEEQKIRFLRRIPIDPITGNADWGMRSVEDSPDSMSWGGRNVFDVFSKSMDTALDGRRYSEW